MNLLLDLLQGIGLGAAAGIRPFLPALVAGALASADLGVDFDDTGLAFLESSGWLLAMALGIVVAFALRARLDSGTGQAALTGLGVGIGALLCAGAIDDRADTWWWGLPVGLVSALLAGAAVTTLLTRVRVRLDRAAAAALPLYADGAAVLLAVLSILVPPVSVVAVAFLAFLLVRGRRREGQKYAGLRILR